VLYNILTEYGISPELVRLIKMRLGKIQNKVCTGINLSCISYSEWFETRICFITAAFQLFFRIYHHERPRK